jgi:hypothetical protein
MLLLVGVFQTNFERVILCSKVLFIPEFGKRMAFYAFWSSTWPSGVRWISGHVEGLWPFIWQVVASLCMALGDAAGASFPGFAKDTYV